MRNFRNHTDLVLHVDARPVVITGPNGSGKTNILESLSLLGPGKGMRRAALPQLQNFDQPDQPWALNFLLQTADEAERIDMGVYPDQPGKQILKVEGTVVSKTALAHLVSVLWVTPFMDQIFMASPSQRRKFLDRMVAMYDPQHVGRLAKYEHALRERSRLLKDGVMDDLWLSALEERLSRDSVAIVALRQEFLSALNERISDRPPLFPKAACALAGGVEDLLHNEAALLVEEEISNRLRQSRHRDGVVGGASIGAHLSDLIVYHLDFNRPAEVCSTGEQKALLLSIMMAQTRLVVHHGRRTPLLLLDEVVAHLDISRRQALFDELCDLGVQAWMTGTDQGHFRGLGERAQFLSMGDTVSPTI